MDHHTDASLRIDITATVPLLTDLREAMALAEFIQHHHSIPENLGAFITLNHQKCDRTCGDRPWD